MNSRITPAHLGRAAVVYVRQSTMSQVTGNLESQRRQYDLAGAAEGTGFRSVTVIDEDLGRSGSGSMARPGFERLVAMVVGGQDTAYAVTLGRLRERDLAVDDDLRAALDGRRDHVDAVRRAVERSRVGEVADDQLRAARRERTEHVLLGRDVANEQADARVRLLQQVMGDAAAERAGRADEEDSLGHGPRSFGLRDSYLPVPRRRISRQKLDSAFLTWNDTG